MLVVRLHRRASTFMGRAIGRAFRNLKQPVIIDNRPGASRLARPSFDAAGGRYTLLSPAALRHHAHVYSNLRYKR